MEGGRGTTQPEAQSLHGGVDTSHLVDALSPTVSLATSTKRSAKMSIEKSARYLAHHDRTRGRE